MTPMRAFPLSFRVVSLGVSLFWIFCAGCFHASSTAPTFKVGEDAPQGGIFLPNQWVLRPAGRSIPLGDFPVDMALSPDRQFAAVVHAGYGTHEVRLISLQSRKVVAQSSVKNLWHGIAYAPDGRALYVSGGGDDCLYRFEVNGATLGSPVSISLHEKEPKTKAWYVSGVAVDPQNRFALVGMQYGNRLLRVDLQNPAFPVEILVAFDHPNAYPYEIAIHPSGETAYVSLWGAKAVAEVQMKNGAVRLIETDSHPCEMALSKDGNRLFVACANTNGVNIIDTREARVIERLTGSLYPNVPPGSTPNAVALDPEETRLWVANADNNTLAVFDISKPGQTRPLGFIPTGWYPTAVAVDPAGPILVVNAKGDSSMANPEGPNPYIRGKEARRRQYIGGLLRGSFSFIDPPDAADLAEHTRQAYLCSPLRPDLLPVGRESGNPIPAAVGEPSPIQYCVYIVKENRTYDQILGDMPEGNGDPTLCLFGEEVTPNHHAIAREFVLLDNFYVESEVSADGHAWTMGAYATDFVEKSWPPSYGGHADYGYKSEGNDPVSDPDEGYLWDRAKEAGISYRSYGEWVFGGGPKCDGVASAASLVGHINPCYSSYNLEVSDLDRADVFLKELKEFEAKGDFPRLAILRLPNDHTAGTSKGKRTPKAYVAQNDLALGRILEGLSNSTFWSKMAVFVVEDDAQNGPDHVDAHRTIAFVVSPYVKRNHIDHTMYSTASMLRSMELILGLRPMSQFDAAARPMYSCFTPEPDLTPYVAKAARVDLEERNPDDAPMQKESSQLNLEREDSNPDVLFNEIIWKSVRGADSEMPAPVRAAFIRPVLEPEEDEI